MPLRKLVTLVLAIPSSPTAIGPLTHRPPRRDPPPLGPASGPGPRIPPTRRQSPERRVKHELFTITLLAYSAGVTKQALEDARAAPLPSPPPRMMTGPALGVGEAPPRGRPGAVQEEDRVPPSQRPPVLPQHGPAALASVSVHVYMYLCDLPILKIPIRGPQTTQPHPIARSPRPQ